MRLATPTYPKARSMLLTNQDDEGLKCSTITYCEKASQKRIGVNVLSSMPTRRLASRIKKALTPVVTDANIEV